MKLHLPKRLFTALLTAITLAAAPAALTLGSAAWGAWTSTNTYTLDEGDNEIKLSEGKGDSSGSAVAGMVFVKPNDASDVAGSITSITFDNDTAKQLVITGAWDGAFNFTNLTVGTLNVNVGGATLNIGGNQASNAPQVVTINGMTGSNSLSSVTVKAGSSLTLDGNNTTYTGVTTVEAGATLTIKHTKALGSWNNMTAGDELGRVVGAGTLVIDFTDSNPDNIDVAAKSSGDGSSLGDFTGVVDIQRGKLYIGNNPGQGGNGGNAGAFGASKVIVRNGAEFWTHSNSAKLTTPQIDLMSGATLGNKDGNKEYTGNIRFNVVDPSATGDAVQYDENGVAYISAYWGKELKYSGLLEGDGTVKFLNTIDTHDKTTGYNDWRVDYYLLNGENKFSGTYELADNEEYKEGNNADDEIRLYLEKSGVAQYASINLSSTKATSKLILGADSTIVNLNGSVAKNLVTTKDGVSATLTVSGGSFAGMLQNGANNGILSLTKTGEDTLTLSGANTYSGNTEITAGTLELTDAGTLGTADAAVISSGAKLQFSGATDKTITQNLTGGGEIAKQGSASVTLTGTVGSADTAISKLTLSGGTLELQNSSYITSIQTSGGANLTFSGENVEHTVHGDLGTTGSMGTITIDAGTTLNVNGSLYSTWGINGIVVDGTLYAGELRLSSNNADNVSGSGVVDVDSFTAANGGRTYSISVDTFKVGKGGISLHPTWATTLDLSSAVTIVEGGISVKNGSSAGKSVLNFNNGSATVAGAVTNAGTINVNSGSVEMQKGLSGTGALHLVGGRLTLNGERNSIGSFAYTGGEFNYSTLTAGAVTISGESTLSNSGHLTVTGTLAGSIENTAAGKVTLSNGMSIAAETSASITGAGITEFGGTLTNNGTLSLGGKISLSGDINQHYVVREAADETGLYVLDYTDTTATNTDGNGFTLTSGGSYWLVQGGTTNLLDDISSREGYTIIQVTDANKAEGERVGDVYISSENYNVGREFYISSGNVNVGTDVQAAATGYTLKGGTMQLTEGSVNTSTITYTSGSITLSDGAELVLDAMPANVTLNDMLTGNGMLDTTSSAGKIVLMTTATLGNNSEATNGNITTTYKGVLSIASGGVLNFGYSKEATADMSSLAGLELDGGTLNYKNLDRTIKNFSVTDNGGTMNVNDYKNTYTTPIKLTGQTTINGAFTLHTVWKSYTQIEALTGDGDFTISTGNNNDAGSNIEILSLNGYTGNFILNPSKTHTNKVNVTLHLGDEDILDYSRISISDTSKVRMIFKGSGTYVMGNTAISSMTGWTDDTWSGTVEVDGMKITDADNDLNNLSKLGNAGSTIKLSGVSGSITSTQASNLILENGTHDFGLKIINGTTDGSYQFNGIISGSGDLEYNLTGSDSHKFYFTKDISQWAAEGEETPEIRVNSDHTLTVYLQDKANTVNVAFVQNNGDLNLTVGTTDAATFNEAVKVNTLTLNQSATFNDTVTASTIAMTSGKVLELAGSEDYTLSANITGNGALTKNGSSSITLSGSIANTLENLTVTAGTLTLDSGIGQQKVLNATINGKVEIKLRDAISYSGAGSISVIGGTLQLDERQSVDSENSFVLTNGTISGTGGDYQSKYIVGLEVHNASTLGITSSGTSAISTGIGLRNPQGSVSFGVTDGTLTVSGGIAGSGNIEKSGAGMLVLSGANTYAGTTSITEGSLVLGESGSLSSPEISISQGAIFEIATTADTTTLNTVSGAGQLLHSGSSATTIASAEGFTGSINVTGGSLTIDSLLVSSTISVNKAAGASLIFTSVTVDELNNHLTLQPGAEVSYKYSEDGVNETTNGNGFRSASATYILFDGYEWETGRVAGYNVSVKENQTLITSQGAYGTVYYVNKGTYTDSNSSNGATAYYIASGANLELNSKPDEKSARDILAGFVVAEEGSDTAKLTIGINDLVTGEANYTTTYSGVLELAKGITFTFGSTANGKEGTDVNTRSLAGVELNSGSVLQYQGSATNAVFKNLTVNAAEEADDPGATFKIIDMPASPAIEFTGVTTLNHDLTILSNYGGKVNIEHLSGSGTLSSTGSDNGEPFTTTIESLAGFTGSLNFTDAEHTVEVFTGNEGVSFKSLSAEGVSSFTFHANTNTTITGTLSASTGTVNIAAGKTLTLGGGTAEAQKQHSIGTLTGGNGSMLNLAQHSVLNTITITPDSGVTLTGSGTYKLASGDKALTSGLTLGTGWTGTVVMREVTGDKNQLNTILNGLTNGTSSKVQLSGVNAWLSTQSTDRLILLENLGNGTAALTLNNGSTSGGGTKTATFAGSVGGSGDIVFSWDTNSSNTTQRHLFSGDTSTWSGKFINENSNTMAMLVEFNRQGSVFSSTVDGGGIVNKNAATTAAGNTGGKLTVKFNNSGNIDFYGTVSKTEGASDTEIEVAQGTVTLHKQVTVDGATVAQNATAKVNSTLAAGTVELGEAATITGKQDGPATMSKVQMSSAGITGTAQDGSSSMSNADIEVLAQDASFTIQDMTLTNTSITAASVNIVNSKVSGNVVLNVVKPAEAITAPNVGQGGTGEISFTYGMALVDSSSTLTLNMEVPQAILPSDSGLYNLTITLNGFAGDFDFSNIANQVVFGADSWLGQALTGASTSVVVDGNTISAGAAAAQSSGAPSVSYNATSASGGNVGKLVITINGLNVPEPTTATLSLLALAALAGRRRRK